MNIFGSEKVLVLTAKTCGPACGNRKIVYLPIDSNHISCIDKKDIILSQLNACQKLLIHVQELDRGMVENEISELKMALDLMH
ncbi:MAG TPA: hypothetical protein VGQ13_09175 [Nitrososphaera sp.]|jgi:hypothetical protein|nr:hypothetical protein [Nitrososphaera sp.]